jgi:predicted RNase H-like nuclease
MDAAGRVFSGRRRGPQEGLMLVCGVDGCRAGWVAVTGEAAGDGLLLREMTVHARFVDVLAAGAACEAIAVDMPIGLSDSGPREADVLARRRLGRPGSSSVFPAPVRCVLATADYLEACSASFAACGRRLSRQTFNILPRIREVDACLGPADQARVIEAHPEVTFRALNAWRALAAGKRKPAGAAERARLLRTVYNAAPQAWLVPAGAARDDLYDAAAIAWTARRHARGEARRLPAQAALDARGLRMEIVY